MGNVLSQEEANGTALGGFFGLIGSLIVTVICPPVELKENIINTISNISKDKYRNIIKGAYERP